MKSLQTSVARRDIDLAILITAREHDSQYDWTMNELAAGKDGLEPCVIEVVMGRKPTTGLTEKDASLIEFGRELFSKHVVAAGTYARTRSPQNFDQTPGIRLDHSEHLLHR